MEGDTRTRNVRMSVAGGDPEDDKKTKDRESSGFGKFGKFDMTSTMPAPSSLGRQKQSVLSGGGSSSRPFLYRGMGQGLGTSYFLEKQAVVIDFGRAYTKVGFATESRPRHIIPTPELRVRRRLGSEVTCTASETEWIDILDRLMSKIFFHYLSVSPKDRRVVVCDSAYATSPFRNALAFVLFKRFSIPSIAWVVDLVLPLYLTGLGSGIVVDLGYESTRVLATFAGVPILSAYGETACAGRHVTARLRKSLREALPPGSPSEWLEDESTMEDVKARTCYVRFDLPTGKDGEQLKLETEKGGSVPLRQREFAQVPEKCRWQPAEILFTGRDDDEDGEDGFEDVGGSHGSVSVIELFQLSLEKCPIDVRAVVLQNVVVCGGCAMLRGLLPRLAVEIQKSLTKDEDTDQIADRLLITPLDFAPVCAVWTGGAVLGALEGADDYTSEDYDRGRPIPDWTRDGYV